MSGTNIYVGDQQITSPLAVNSTVNDAAVPVVKTVATAQGEAPVYVFSANYTTMWQGQTVSFRVGVPYQFDAALLAFLTANAAPIFAA